jgi:putative phosphoribosyl transferase
MSEVTVGRRVTSASAVFRDRAEAGQRLAEFLEPEATLHPMVLGLPRGGVPVGEALARRYDAPLIPLIARKLPVPSSPEMGFGAVAIDGSLVLNEQLVTELGLPRDRIDSIAAEVREEVERRAKEYMGDDVIPDVRGKEVFLVDDGLATGYSVIAAARMVKDLEPRSLILAVPVSPEGSLRTVAGYFDEVYCLIAQEYPPFAVASFYQDFHDMSDDEVRRILKRANRDGQD